MCSCSDDVRSGVDATSVDRETTPKVTTRVVGGGHLLRRVVRDVDDESTAASLTSHRLVINRATTLINIRYVCAFNHLRFSEVIAIWIDPLSRVWLGQPCRF